MLDDVGLNACESHFPAQNPDFALIAGHSEAVTRLQAKLIAYRRGKDNPAALTKNYRFCHGVPPYRDYAIFWRLSLIHI